MATTPIPTTLIIDFYDSYTRNLLSLFSKLGNLTKTTTNLSDLNSCSDSNEFKWDLNGWQERVIVINVDSMTWESFVETILPFISCVILGPGPGSPHKSEDFSWPTRLIKEFGSVLPILGVCLGHQGLATTFGGNVIKAPAPIHGQLTKIRHESNNPLFNDIPNHFGAIQFNSLVVADEGLPNELEVLAWGSNQGIENIMALRHRTKPIWGVQFHPESIASTYGATLLSNFLRLVKLHHSTTSTSTINPLHPLPPRIRSLTTSYIRGTPNPIPDIPSLDPASNSKERWRWEQRSVVLEGAGCTLMPEEVFERFVKGGNPLGEIWLDSARATVSPQSSHLLLPQLTWSFCQSTNDITIRTSPTLPPTKRHLTSPSTFFTALGTSQAHLKRNTLIHDITIPSIPIGFVGYLAYEMKETTLPFCTPITPLTTPERTDAEFAFVSTALSFEHGTGLWRVTGLIRTASLEEGGKVEEGEGEGFGLSPLEWKDYLSTVFNFFASPIATTSVESIEPTSISLASLIPDLDCKPYQSAINSAKSHIVAGSAYELCLTTQFRRTLPTSVASNPFSLYKSLRNRNPAPYSSYFNLPLSNLSLLSSSPERYMRIESTGQVEMKPIKGTVRRCLDDPVEDERRRKGLEADEKERAENLMIVDLCRNDLLGFCKVESVLVPRLMVVESYQTVHQLVSSIVGTLSPVVNPFEAIARAFPPGSMTGAPKLRSVQLLEELEGNRPRGPYAGVFGYVAIDGTTDFSVVIRTLVIKENNITMGAGGAITHLSVPENEWEEALLKAEAVLGSK